MAASHGVWAPKFPLTEGSAQATGQMIQSLRTSARNKKSLHDGNLYGLLESGLTHNLI